MKVFFLFLFFLNSIAYGDTQVYRGEAKLKGKLVYKELHTIIQENGKIISSETVYTNPKGEIIARLTNSYSQSLNLPEHTMQDIRHKNIHGLKYLNGSPVMFNQDDKESEETKKIEMKDYKGKLVVGGQGLHYYLVSNFETVVKNKTLKLKFIIPGRLDAYDFYLKFIGQSEGKVIFEVEIDNWFLKLFAPKLKMIYDAKLKRLLSYSGLSNIRTEDKEMMNVDIDYIYE
jgi:hypothetical protein